MHVRLFTGISRALTNTPYVHTYPIPLLFKLSIARESDGPRRVYILSTKIHIDALQCCVSSQLDRARIVTMDRESDCLNPIP